MNKKKIFAIVMIPVAFAGTILYSNHKIQTLVAEKDALRSKVASQMEETSDKNETNVILSAENATLKDNEEKLTAEIDTLKAQIEDETKIKEAEAAKAAAQKATKEATYTVTYNGSALSPSKGSIIGPSGKETYYNLNMSYCVAMMRALGFSEAEYPYWIRGDGAKMLGSYVMVAADFGLRPKGTIVATSLGTGIVVDTGGFAESNPTQLDICTNW